MLHWLFTPLGGNTPLDCLLAALWLGLIPLAGRLLKPRLLRRLSAAGDAPRRQRALLAATAAVRVTLLAVIALNAVNQQLTLPAQVAHDLQVVATAGLFAQVGLCSTAFADAWISTPRPAAQRMGAPASDGLAATSFFIRLLLWTLLALSFLDNVGVNVTTLLAGLGVGGIAISLAAQNILGDLFSSLSIVLDKPFQVGHFVIIDGFSGTVERIGLKTTRIRSLNGEVLVFANADLTKARLRNYRWMQERRVEFTFGVDHAASADHLRRIPGLLRELIQARRHTRFERAHFKAIRDSALEFEVVYWVTTADYLLYMDIQQHINLDLLEQLRALGVRLAAPTRVVHLRGHGAEPVS